VDPLGAVIFDLDDTLFPVSSLPATALAPAVAAARAANVGVEALPADRLERALADAFRFPFPMVVTMHALPPALVQAWDAANRALAVTADLTAYEDVVPVLTQLRVRRFLVTTGYRQFQESKLVALGIGDLFDRVYIDAVDDGSLAPKGKTAVFRQLLDEWRLSPAEVLVVGDSEAGELAAGRSLGMPTVQILRPGVSPAQLVDWRIVSLEELPALIDRIDGPRR
jgi:HAD superfamily hydrolase (TIGR01509 family)